MKLDVAALRNGVTVADGGWSTQLWMRGVPAGGLTELANLTHPHIVAVLVMQYVEAGARFITTNTFSANRLALEKRRVTADVREINETGVRVVRESLGDASVAVVGSIGPSGKIMAVGEATEAQLIGVFEEQARALADGGADAILLETFSEPAEILVALKAARNVCALPVIASMSFDSGPQRTRTMMGSRAEECAATLDEAGADIVGCNCGGGINNVLPAVVALRGATERPLWVKPNAGLPELEDGRAVYKQTPEEFGSYVSTLIDAGANVIGGCCGSGPEHIRRVAALVASRKRAGDRP